MRLAVSLFLAATAFAATPYYRVDGDQPTSWPRLLESAGFLPHEQARLVVLT
ncbi:MAG: hypothetical protein JNN08_05850, partial [Bryobacterales bacterium]|nr:hypothetical protein [Bryobacterales bacterium]